jgi:hypothetical protein
MCVLTCHLDKPLALLGPISSVAEAEDMCYGWTSGKAGWQRERIQAALSAEVYCVCQAKVMSTTTTMIGLY